MAEKDARNVATVTLPDTKRDIKTLLYEGYVWHGGRLWNDGAMKHDELFYQGIRLRELTHKITRKTNKL